jgi:Rieske Fe-S protein
MGCAALGLAACGGGSSATPAAGGAASSAAPPPGSGTSPTAAGGGVIVKVADIPVGGAVSGRAPSGEKLLLTRPTATSVLAFSSVCTHQQCTVEPDGKRFACPCHGSIYDLTGKNISGPAPAPLHPFAVKISGTDVVAA